jgi:hypothetical protein
MAAVRAGQRKFIRNIDTNPHSAFRRGAQNIADRGKMFVVAAASARKAVRDLMPHQFKHLLPIALGKEQLVETDSISGRVVAALAVNPSGLKITDVPTRTQMMGDFGFNQLLCFRYIHRPIVNNRSQIVN